MFLATPFEIFLQWAKYVKKMLTFEAEKCKKDFWSSLMSKKKVFNRILKMNKMPKTMLMFVWD